MFPRLRSIFVGVKFVAMRIEVVPAERNSAQCRTVGRSRTRSSFIPRYVTSGKQHEFDDETRRGRRTGEFMVLPLLRRFLLFECRVSYKVIILECKHPLKIVDFNEKIRQEFPVLLYSTTDLSSAMATGPDENSQIEDYKNSRDCKVLC